MNSKLKSALVKFAVVGVYALLGAAVQAELLPEAVAAFLRDNVVEAVFVAMGLGHVIRAPGQETPKA